MNSKILILTSCFALAACGNTFDRLSEAGGAPVLQKVENPTAQPNYQPLNWPTPLEASGGKQPNSLWQTGARSFFKDQRATRVGDILTVLVKINDKADLTNGSQRARTTTESLAATQFLGLDQKLKKVLPGDPQLGNLVDINGASNSDGNGTIGRQENIETKVAAVITQVLPNGNLAVKGTQEVRVNYELRQVTVEGVIRPEDISSDNTISSEQIAEARISYGGKGLLSDVQQPRIGNQLIDILSPF